MDPILSDFLITIGGVSILSTAGLIAWWLTLRSRRDARRALPNVEALQAELEAVRTDFQTQITELQERVDFAERMLARSPTASLPPRPE